MSSYVAAHLKEIGPRQLPTTVVDTLRDAGFSSSDALSVMSTIFYYVSGAMLAAPAEHRISAWTATRLRAEYHRGLDIVLEGVRSFLEASRWAPSA